MDVVYPIASLGLVPLLVKHVVGSNYCYMNG